MTKQKATWSQCHMFISGIGGRIHRDDLARIIRLARDRSSIDRVWGNAGVRRIEGSYFVGSMHFFRAI